MKKLLVAALVLSGCYSKPTTKSYAVDCLTFWTDNRMDQANLDRLLHNVQLARKLLAVSLIPEAQFCSSFSNVYIHIRPEAIWHCPGAGECSGMTWYSGEIEVNRKTTSLAHELMHEWDNYHSLVTKIGGHEGWDTNGRDQLDRDYVWDMRPLLE